MINNKYNIGDTVIFIGWNEQSKCYEIFKDIVEEIGLSKEGIIYYCNRLMDIEENELFTLDEALQYLKTKLENNDK